MYCSLRERTSGVRNASLVCVGVDEAIGSAGLALLVAAATREGWLPFGPPPDAGLCWAGFPAGRMRTGIWEGVEIPTT